MAKTECLDCDCALVCGPHEDASGLEEEGLECVTTHGCNKMCTCKGIKDGMRRKWRVGRGRNVGHSPLYNISKASSVLLTSASFTLLIYMLWASSDLGLRRSAEKVTYTFSDTVRRLRPNFGG